MSKKQSMVSVDGVAGRSPASRYSDEFKRDAVRLVSEEKYSFQAAATAVNVSQKRLREWHARIVPPPKSAVGVVLEHDPRSAGSRAPSRRRSSLLTAAIPWPSGMNAFKIEVAKRCSIDQSRSELGLTPC